MARNYSPLTLKQLFLTSGHHCAFPGCASRIVDLTPDGPVILGEIAHIEGSSDSGPRANPALSAAQRDHYSNLIVLCAHHHTLVDKRPSSYGVEELRGWKTAAETATVQRLSIGATSVSFAELEVVCNAFADGDMGTPSTPMVAVPPKKKMQTNGLTSAVTPVMNIGLAQAPLVADYIRRQAELSTTFPQRLRTGFLAEYDRLRSAGVCGDALFLALIDFGANSATSPQMDLSRVFVVHAAATAVLCHLFEVCDLFETPA